MKKYFVLLILLFAISSPVVNSFEFRGNLSSDLYFWDEEGGSHIRPYETLRGMATLYRGGNQQSIGFKTNLRWTTDLSDKFDSDPQLFVYETNLKFSHLPRNYYFTIGRQFIYNNAGTALIDGAKIKYLNNDIQFEIFAGAIVNRLDPEKIQSFDKYLTYGLYSKKRYTKKILFMERLVVGGGYFISEDENILVQHKGALDLRFNIAATRVFFKYTMDLKNINISELRGRISQANSGWYYSLEFRNRKPSVSNNSVFSIIESKSYNQFRLEINRKLNQKFTLISGFNYTIYSDDNNLRAQLGLSHNFYSISFYHQAGYGGEQNGLTGYGRMPLKYGWELIGSANLSRYKIQDEHNELSNAYSTHLGLSKKFKGDWQLRAEWQMLNNAISDIDSRFHFRVSKGFSFK